MQRVLVLAGPAGAAAFADLVESNGFAPTVVDPGRNGPGLLERGGVDVVLAVGEAAAAGPDRAWGEAIIAFVERGGGLVCCRPAVGWFDGWDRWAALLGLRPLAADPADHDPGGHDPADHDPADHDPADHDPADRRRIGVDSPVRFAARTHPVTAGLAPPGRPGTVPPPFDAAEGTDVLARLDERAVVWTATAGNGRIVVDSLTYDAGALSQPSRRTLVERALRWVGET